MKREDLAPEGSNVGGSFAAAARPVIGLDVEKYQAYLDNSGMSDAQKEEFLQSLWTIIVSFVELGFGVHPLQEVCGQNLETVTSSESPESGNVESKQSERCKPQTKAGPPGGLEEE